MIAEHLETLENSRETAKIGFLEGIGYIPFAGIGWDAYRKRHMKDPNPARAAAWRRLQCVGIRRCYRMRWKNSRTRIRRCGNSAAAAVIRLSANEVRKTAMDGR